jgi:hypothetical protein
LRKKEKKGRNRRKEKGAFGTSKKPGNLQETLSPGDNGMGKGQTNFIFYFLPNEVRFLSQ